MRRGRSSPSQRPATWSAVLVLCVASSLVMTALVGGARGSELRDDFEDVADFDAILGAAEPTFGERYGGAFIDRSVNPAVLRVTVVDATFPDAGRLARISRSNPRVQLGSAEHSKAILDRAARAIEAVLTNELDGRYWSVGVDERSSRIEVSAKQLSDRLRMRLDALAPANAISYDISSDNGYTLLADCRNCRAARALAMTPHRAVDLRPGFLGLTRVTRLAHHRVVDASGAAGHGLGVGDARYCGSGRQVGLSPDRRSAAWQSRTGHSPAVIVQDLQSGRRQVLRRACRPAWSRDGRLAFIRGSGHFKAYAEQPAGVPADVSDTDPLGRQPSVATDAWRGSPALPAPSAKTAALMASRAASCSGTPAPRPAPDMCASSRSTGESARSHCASTMPGPECAG